ncbi:hypothetical protein ZIOFF_036043 [Zingiber officinale]|uniref:Uncharacterized protein n=1 Tax=Zingiber officinale TaxID=94328 RepID=A0A8J5GHJ5_ZINOF|nr:hypothetical protein ZIOFF_036043 [Zingiber officinale]
MENTLPFRGRRRRRYLLHFDLQKIGVLCSQKVWEQARFSDGNEGISSNGADLLIYPSSTCFRWHDRLAECLLGFSPPQSSEQELPIISLHHLAEIPCNGRLISPKKKKKQRSLLLRHRKTTTAAPMAAASARL